MDIPWTKGPWTVDDSQSGTIGVFVVDSDRHIVAGVPGPRKVHQRAHLISAAPDLIEALEESTGNLRNTCRVLSRDGYGDTAFIKTITKLIAVNENALSKAKGEAG